jgi:hypothetical protein
MEDSGPTDGFLRRGSGSLFRAPAATPDETLPSYLQFQGEPAPSAPAPKWSTRAPASCQDVEERGRKLVIVAVALHAPVRQAVAASQGEGGYPVTPVLLMGRPQATRLRSGVHPPAPAEAVDGNESVQFGASGQGMDFCGLHGWSSSNCTQRCRSLSQRHSSITAIEVRPGAWVVRGAANPVAIPVAEEAVLSGLRLSRLFSRPR